MKNKIEFYNSMMASASSNYPTDIKISSNRNLDLLPSVNIDNSQIKFNERLILLFIMLNIGLKSKNHNNIWMTYFLTILFISYNYYDEAAIMLTDLESVCLKTDLLCEHKNEIEQIIDLQILFILFHEFFHIVFNQNPKIKLQAYESTKNMISYSILGSSFIHKICNFFLKNKGINIKNSLNDDVFLEEFSCDINSWYIMKQIHDFANHSEEEKYSMCLESLKSAYFIELINQAQDLCTQSGYEYESTLKRATKVSYRVNVLSDRIGIHIYSELKKYSRQYDKYSMKLLTMDRIKFSIHSVLKFLDGFILTEGANLPNIEKSRNLMNKLETIEAMICDNFDLSF